MYVPVISQLNDPFESNIYINERIDERQISIKSILPFLVMNSNDLIKYDLIKSKYHGISFLNEIMLDTENYSNIYESIKDVYKTDIEDIIYKAAKRIGIFSMTTIKDSLLMWSHYADSHKGICIEFSRTNENELGNRSRCFPVEYSSFVKNIDVIDLKDANVFKVLFDHKSDDWSYEKEWRYLIPEGKKLIDFPGKISKIYFGLKCKEEIKNQIMSVLSKDVEYYEMSIVKNEYVLSEKKI
jgi:hypothetical protein